MSKARLLELSFPYDWSNPAISDEALILNVLERGLFEDVCRICAYYGVETVERAAAALPDTRASQGSLARMFSNIRKGFAHAQS